MIEYSTFDWSDLETFTGSQPVNSIFVRINKKSERCELSKRLSEQIRHDTLYISLYFSKNNQAMLFKFSENPLKSSFRVSSRPIRISFSMKRFLSNYAIDKNLLLGKRIYPVFEDIPRLGDCFIIYLDEFKNE